MQTFSFIHFFLGGLCVPCVSYHSFGILPETYTQKMLHLLSGYLVFTSSCSRLLPWIYLRIVLMLLLAKTLQVCACVYVYVCVGVIAFAFVSLE